MANVPDPLTAYCSFFGFTVRSKIVLVEGTTDRDLFELCSRLVFESSGEQLVGSDLAIVPAGERDLGGTQGVLRELVCLRGLARACLLPSGKPRYRVIALFDNDTAGQKAAGSIKNYDRSMLEFKDVFRLWPVMPRPTSLDPISLQRAFEQHNSAYKGLHWELEDLLSKDILTEFVNANPCAVSSMRAIADKKHYNFTAMGKSQLHHFIKENAIRRDLEGVVDSLRSLRWYLGLT